MLLVPINMPISNEHNLTGSRNVVFFIEITLKFSIARMPSSSEVLYFICFHGSVATSMNCVLMKMDSGSGAQKSSAFLKNILGFYNKPDLVIDNKTVGAVANSILNYVMYEITSVFCICYLFFHCN